MKNVRVWMPIFSFYCYGGGERQAEKIARELTKLNIEVKVLTAIMNKKPRSPQLCPGFTVQLLPYIFKGTFMPLRKLATLFFIIELFFYMLINHSKYDVLQTYFMDKFTVITILCALLTRKPVIILEANEKTSYRTRKYYETNIFQRFSYYIFSKATAIVAISKKIEDEFLKVFKLNPDKIHMIPNGVEIYDIQDKKELRKKLNLPLDTPIGINLGRLHPQKNHIYMFETWNALNQKMPEALLLCLGDGYKKEEYENFIKENHYDKNIILLGAKDNAIDYLQAADLYFFPSLYEGMPNALIEAMSVGLPCVASKIEAHTPIIQQDHNGLMFDLEMSENDVADIIANVFNNQELANKLGQNARDKIKQFSVSRIAAIYADMYTKFVQEYKNIDLEELQKLNYND